MSRSLVDDVIAGESSNIFIGSNNIKNNNQDYRVYNYGRNNNQKRLNSNNNKNNGNDNDSKYDQESVLAN